MTPDYEYNEKCHIRFFNCDNMDFMKEVEDKKYAISLVDPPYGIGVNVNMGRRKGNKKSKYHKFEGNDCVIPEKIYFDELFRISNNQIIWGANYMIQYLKPSPCWIVWDKGFSEEVTFAQIELAWTSFTTSAKKYDYNAAKNRNRIHPTQKPIALYRWILQNYAKKGDKILDTHGGSMTLARACYEEGFDLDIMELDKEYFDKGVQKFKEHISQYNLF